MDIINMIPEEIRPYAVNGFLGCIAGVIYGVSGYWKAMKESKKKVTFDIKKFGTVVVASGVIGIGIGVSGQEDPMLILSGSGLAGVIIKNLVQSYI